MGQKQVDYINKRGIWQSSPLHRFMITDALIIHFHAFYWGLTYAGSCMTIKDAANIYLKRFTNESINPETLEQGFYRLNRLFVEIGRK